MIITTREGALNPVVNEIFSNQYTHQIRVPIAPHMSLYVVKPDGHFSNEIIPRVVLVYTFSHTKHIFGKNQREEQHVYRFDGFVIDNLDAVIASRKFPSYPSTYLSKGDDHVDKDS